jgi:hypothetical protein
MHKDDEVSELKAMYVELFALLREKRAIEIKIDGIEEALRNLPVTAPTDDLSAIGVPMQG